MYFFLASGNLFVQKCKLSGVVGYNVRVLFIFLCFYIGFGGGVGEDTSGQSYNARCKEVCACYGFLKRLK